MESWDLVSVSRRVSRPVSWSLDLCLGLEGLVSVSKDFGLRLELCVSSLCICYLLWSFARSSLQKRFKKMIVKNLAIQRVQWVSILCCYVVLQLTASPWTTEASSSERWQFGALTNKTASSGNRAPSLSSLYYYKVALSLYRDKRITIIRLWWLSQWLVTHGHHLAVTIHLHVTPSTDRHSCLRVGEKNLPSTLFEIYT